MQMVVSYRDLLLSKKCAPMDLQLLLFCISGFTVLLLAEKVHHPPSSQREKCMILILMNLLTNCLSSVISADSCLGPRMNTFFSVKSWELLFIISAKSFSVLYHQIAVRYKKHSFLK